MFQSEDEADEREEDEDDDDFGRGKSSASFGKSKSSLGAGKTRSFSTMELGGGGRRGLARREGSAYLTQFPAELRAFGCMFFDRKHVYGNLDNYVYVWGGMMSTRSYGTRRMMKSTSYGGSRESSRVVRPTEVLSPFHGRYTHEVNAPTRGSAAGAGILKRGTETGLARKPSQAVQTTASFVIPLSGKAAKAEKEREVERAAIDRELYEGVFPGSGRIFVNSGKFRILLEQMANSHSEPLFESPS